MIGAFLTFLANSRLARMIGTAIAAVAAVMTFGAIKRREGVQTERAKQAAQDAQDHTETVERVLDEKPSDDPVADIRKRMRDRARK